MIDRKGHIIHIDFGFMLGMSPGGINAEGSLFKLTFEFVEAMGGVNSQLFLYFKVLLIRGYIEARKHMDDFLLMVEMVGKGSKLPCFQQEINVVVSALRDRFNPGLTESQIVDLIERMVEESNDSWRVRFYDSFQKMTNGIEY